MVFCLLSAVAASMYLAEVQASSASKSLRIPLRRRDTELDLSRRATGEVDLSSAYYNVNWDVSLKIGGQQFTVGVDTGSSPLWVLSTRLSAQNQSALSSHGLFDPSQSSTFQHTSRTFTLAYDKGENYLGGDVGVDNVQIGGLTASMPFGLATSVSRNVTGNNEDGTFGMAFGTSNQLGKGAPTFMEAVMSQLDEPVFSFNLPLGSEQSLEFGQADNSLYSGNLQTVAINNGTPSAGQGWQAQLSYSMNGKNISSSLQHTIFDTGGITALADEDVVRTYWGQVNGARDTSNNQDATNWDFPCKSALPDLTYNLLGPDGGFVNATVPGRFFNYTALWRTKPTSNTCQGGLQSNGDGNGGTMGYAFWHSFFTVFNQSAPTVSFAPYPSNELGASASVTGTLATATPTGIPSLLPTSGSSGIIPTAGGAAKSSSSHAAGVARHAVDGSGSGIAAALMYLLMLVI